MLSDNERKQRVGISDHKATPNNRVRMAVRKYCSLYIRTRHAFLVVIVEVHVDMIVVVSCHCAAFEAVTSSLVSLHVASDTERLATTLMRALEWFLTGM